MPRFRTALLACLAGSTLPATPLALADIDEDSVYRLNIPDLDQRRSAADGIFGLPGGGNSHCVPTSAVNWLGYLANRGYPEVLVPNGPQFWQENDFYNDMTQTIANIGDIMGTSTDGGTSYSAHPATLQSWLDVYYEGSFTTSSKSLQGTNVISMQQMRDTMASGGMICFGTQRWQPRPAEIIIDLENNVYNMPPRYVHTSGGHMVTVSRIYDAASTTPTIFVRDPADDTLDLFSQSVFSDKAIPLTRNFGPYAYGLTTPPLERLQYQISCGSSCSMVHFYSVIKNVYGVAGFFDLFEGKIVYKGLNTTDLLALPDQDADLPGDLELVTLDIDPMMAFTAVVARDPATNVHTLWRHVQARDTWTLLDTLSGPTPICFSPWGELLYCSAGALRSMNLSGDAPADNVSIPMSETPAAIAFDDENDIAYMLLPAVQKVRAAAARMSSGFFDQDLPPGAAIDADSCLAVSRDGASLFATASGSIFRITFGGAGAGLVLAETITHPSIVNPRNLQVDHRGHVLFTSNGVARELAFNRATAQWEPVPTAKFAGDSVGDVFRVSQSRIGKDEAPASPDQFADTGELDGTSIPDCFADFNADGTVDVPDIFAFLSAWFAQNPTADVNLDFAVGVPDIFTFLAAWFAGCE